MDYNIEFIIVDVRHDKSIKLQQVEGIQIYSIDTTDLIESIEAHFNDAFIESRGKEHFLFLLNTFSF